MKKIKYIVSLVLAASLFSACLTSCEKEKKTETGFDIFDISAYDIVFSSSADASVKASANALKNRIEKGTSASLDVRDDRESTDKEILVGYTDRVESKALRDKLDVVKNEKAFAIEVNGNKICIMGKNADVTVRAVKYFAVNYIVNGKVDIPENLSIAQAANTSTVIIPENLVELKISEKKRVYAPSDKLSTDSLYYPTAAVLQYQENPADNGKIIATLNSSEYFYRILESTDGGDSWSEKALVSDKTNANCRGGRMPMLYELPADMGSYKKGTIVLAGTSSALNSSSEEKSAIVIYYSTDCGETWTGGQSIDFGAGRTDGDGIWEPCLIFDESTGRLYCFYSDDRDAAHDQKIVYKYTVDGVTWVGSNGNTVESAPFDAVASSEASLRPGMVSITKMSNGEYIMVYEVGHSKYGDSTATVHYKKSTDLADWSDISDVGPMVMSTDNRAFGSAPWCAYSEMGGENGLFITTGRYRDDRNSDPSEPDLFISFDYGKTFVTIDNPFDYKNTDLNLGKFGYSPYFVVANDGKTIYYFNTSFFKPANKTQCIEMVEIEIMP